MVKPRKDRQRKRKFYGNHFTPSKTNDEKRSRSDDNGLQNGSGSEHCQQTQASSSSFRKLSLDLGEQGPQSSRSRSICDDAQPDEKLTGFRLFRLECIINFFQSFPCPSCLNSQELEDNFHVTEKLNGINSSLTLVCRSCKATVNLQNDENVNLRFQAG